MDPSNPTIAITTDAYAPAQMAERVCKIGLAKVTMPVPTMIALAVLAGAFISLGALFYTVTVTGAVGNLVLVTIGNMLGGTVLAALVYWFVYLRGEGDRPSPFVR